MAELPEPIVTAIVRGMGAYMRSARRTDLPSALRSLQGKHLKMLNTRRSSVVGALDDPGLRAMLVEWLDDKPTGISKPDAEVLSIAARRDDGWEDKLIGKVPVARSSSSGKKDATSTIDREKERARKARDEAQRIKEEAAREVTRERAVATKLRNEVKAFEQKVATMGRTLEAVEKERDQARAELDRELRKARKRAEKAEASLEATKADVRSLRQELAATKSTPASSKKNPVPARRPAPVEPAKRLRLQVPKGRFADAPETLTAWLSTPNVHLLIDGYNVSKAEGGFGDLGLETQRERVLQEVGKLARRHKIKATVIFDGSDVAPGTSRRARGPVEVEYSRSDEIADDHLIAKLEGLPRYPVVVVTNDKELQRRAARLGATIATSDQLLALIR